MYDYNPIYNTYPETPPGLSGLPYVVAPMIAEMSGGVAHPYLPPNQSAFDALAARTNDRFYKQMMSRQYGQMGYQLLNTAGGTRMAEALGRAAGLDPRRVRAELSGMGAGFGSSMAGAFIMPMADTLMERAGISGGSFVDAVNTVMSSRMAMASQGTIFNPLDVGQQEALYNSANAMSSILNSLVSRSYVKSGKRTVMLNTDFTLGFDRSTVNSVAMDMLRGGAFNRHGIGMAEQLRLAAGKYNVGTLNAVAGDFDVGAYDENTPPELSADASISGDSKEAKQLAKLKDRYAKVVGAGIQVMGAMRDFLKTDKGLREKINALTNGEWNMSESSAIETANAVRKLTATAQMYNMDPKTAMGRIFSNRGLLQDAAGVDGNMRFFGYDGGGMFRLRAQTSLLGMTEDMISARGIDPNSVAADRIRKQSVQAMARNQNTWAGRATQLLAYARQQGTLSEKEAEEFRTGLMSGDRAVMDDTINKLLVTQFGSTQRGREMMNDRVFFQAMQNNTSQAAGDWALKTIAQGAAKEFMNRERITATENRLAFSKDILAGFGMKTTQTGEGVGLAVGSVVSMLNEYGQEGKDAAAAFKSIYDRMRAKGMKENSAYSATLNAMRNNPAMTQFVEKIETAANQKFAENNERMIIAEGDQSGQANAMLRAMSSAKAITGKQAAEGFKMIREGKADEALSYAKNLAGGLDEGTGKYVEAARADAAKRYSVAVDSIESRREASDLLDDAAKRDVGSTNLYKTYTELIGAATKFRDRETSADADTDKRLKDAAVERFYDQVSKTRAVSALGKDKYDEFVNAVIGGKATPDTISALVKRMGGVAMKLQEMSAGNLEAGGYNSLVYDGFWGYGANSGNSAEIEKRRGQMILDLANAGKDANDKAGRDRQTFAQDFMDLLASEGNYKSLLKIYDRDGTLKSAAGDVFDLQEEYLKKKDIADKKGKDIDEVSSLLTKAEHPELADAIRGFWDDPSKLYKAKPGEKPEDIEAAVSATLQQFVADNGIDKEIADKFIPAVLAKRSAYDAKEATLGKAKEIFNTDDMQKAMSIYHENVDWEKSQAKFYDDTKAFINGMDYSMLDIQDPKGALKEAIDAAEDAVSDKRLSQEGFGGRDLDNYSDGQKLQKRLQIMMKDADAGVEEAREGMNKFKVAAAEGVQKIRGTITIQQGEDSAPALLDGNVGGM